MIAVNSTTKACYCTSPDTCNGNQWSSCARIKCKSLKQPVLWDVMGLVIDWWCTNCDRLWCENIECSGKLITADEDISDPLTYVCNKVHLLKYLYLRVSFTGVFSCSAEAERLSVTWLWVRSPAPHINMTKCYWARCCMSNSTSHDLWHLHAWSRY